MNQVCVLGLQLLLGLIVYFPLIPDATAGGGPETTLVVVNARSPLSKRIANEYVHLRQIPTNHVVWLEEVPSVRSTSIETYREKVWQPINSFLRTHGLDDEIDVIAYSADFPYGVDFTSDLKSREIQKHKHLGTRASLTALTYFARRVETGDIGYLQRNHYFADFAGPKINKTPDQLPVSAHKLSEKEITDLRKEAKNALGRKDYAAAAAAYRKIRDSYPDKSRTWYDLSRGLAAAGKQEEALSVLTSAVDLGWTQSLLTAKDRYLKPLHRDPRFGRLLERMKSAYGPFQLPHGFSNRYVWSNSDLARWEPGDDLDRYYLSTLLAYTGIRGNSLPEVMNYLTSAAASDGTLPEGTVYLLENSNIRSETRQPLFTATVAELERRGRKVEILSKGEDNQDGIVPKNKNDVIGAVVGSRDYKWGGSGSRLLPGAIAESLTSYGGDFNNGSQTKLTELLRYGAAGSSGAVMEPYAFQEKFPVPLLHAYYADGCSLAEAFYQSLVAPYQLIVVGDPLARPFARFAEVRLHAPDPASPWSGRVNVIPDVRAVPGKGIDRVELWIDGRLVAGAPAGETIVWDTGSVEEGYHELRLVAIEDSLIETRSFARFNIHVDNGGSSVRIDDLEGAVGFGEEIPVSGTASGAELVGIFQGYRKLGEAPVRDGRWKVVVDSADLGTGPVSLQARALTTGETVAQSAPLLITIEEPGLIDPVADIKSPVAGLTARINPRGGEPYAVSVDDIDSFLKDLNKRKIGVDSLSLQGYFKIGTPGFYQLLGVGNSSARVSIDDKAVMEMRNSKDPQENFLPLGLAEGWHRLRIDLQGSRRGSNPRLILVGAEVARILSDKNLYREDARAVSLN